MNESAPLGTQAGQLWADVTAWLSAHSVQILLGVVLITFRLLPLDP